MDYDSLLTLQGYSRFFMILVIFIIFYSYSYSIYKRDKSGERDYEKYSKLVHDDSSVSAPLEERKKDKDIDNKEK